MLADPLAIANDGVLPTDVLSEILLRLPAKELCRLRLVCRKSGDLRLKDDSWGPASPSTEPGHRCSQRLARRQRMPCASTCVLGHVPSTVEYKLLRIGYRRRTIHETAEQPCEVMTLGCGSNQRWRKKSGPPFQLSSQYRHVVVSNGVAYFLSAPFSIANTKTKMDRIALFNLGTEEWSAATLQLPPSTRYDPKTDDYIQLAKLNGYFAIVHHSKKHCSMNFWFLVDMDKGLWNKQCSIVFWLSWMTGR
ncbi:hypothetical protein BAE44_0020605 [Dichanthelium oligosanthes]|uniref:F-box domain-containing protein n=1 Tax=Dichanthelium oligosanthes TaxID=888268 RepID=A0A1E5UZV4_9POAL|nr:hypothetical protein BAE44_0020605 [Dichanthelium oligosanthes]